MKLTREDTLNLIDTLLEWEKHPDLGPKEMGEDDAGLDSERYTDLMQRLIDDTWQRYEPRENKKA